MSEIDDWTLTAYHCVKCGAKTVWRHGCWTINEYDAYYQCSSCGCGFSLDFSSSYDPDEIGDIDRIEKLRLRLEEVR